MTDDGEIIYAPDFKTWLSERLQDFAFFAFRSIGKAAGWVAVLGVVYFILRQTK